MDNRIRKCVCSMVIVLMAYPALGSATALAYVVSSNSQIGPGTVAGHQPPAGKHTNIISGSVNATDLAPAAVTNTKLGNGAVTANKVAANTLTGGQINELSLDFAMLQRRIATACAAGQAIRAVNKDGTVTCQSVPGGTVTSVGSGTGLSGGPITGSGTLSIADPFRLPQACANGQVPKWNGTGWDCGNDSDTGPSHWSLTGNSGTGSGDFLGTTDNQPLDLRVNNARGLRIDPASDGTNQSPNVIGGIGDNSVTPGVFAATIAGGGRSFIPQANTANLVTDSYGAVGGGGGNLAGDAAGTVDDRQFATVAGGLGNGAFGQWSTVAGGANNLASGQAAAVGGGAVNHATATRATVGGGDGNTAGASNATVGGGFGNTANGGNNTVGGGSSNTAGGINATIGGGSTNTTSGIRATVAGGAFNTAGNLEATVGGGGGNTAGGEDSTVPGGTANVAAGNRSFAAGYRAKANHTGAFVWADSNNFDFSSSAQDEFSVRATGGARFVSAIDPSTGAPTAGVQLASGGGSWSSLSDRAAKRAIEPASGRSVLRRLASMPVSTWSYRAQDPSIRHIGPMAQDFYRAFGVGEDRRHIASVDADGVALAAVKGVNRRLNQKVKRLQREITALRKRVGSR